MMAQLANYDTEDAVLSGVPSIMAENMNSTTSNMTLTGLGNATEDPSTTDPPFDWDAYYYSQFLYNVELNLTLICYCITMLVGILGNVIVVYTIWRCRHLHTVMYTLLASLAVADLIMVGFVLPWRLYFAIYNGSWTFGEFLCRFPMYLYLLSAVSSVLHLTVISLERCYAVLFPLRSRTVLTMGNAHRIVIIVWAVAILASIPILFSRSVKEIDDNRYRCLIHWTEIPRRAFSLYSYFLVFGAPMILIVGAYSIIFMTLYKRRAPEVGMKTEAMPTNQARKYQAVNGTARTSGSVHTITNGSKLHKNTARNKKMEIKQMTMMLLVVICLFAISWGPTVTVSVLKSFDVIDIYGNVWYMVNTVFAVMSFMNSAINPIVYALVSPSFRESCKWALKVCCKSRRVRRRASAVSRTTAISRIGAGTGGGSVSYVDNVSVSSGAYAGDKM